jgi:hypothetical protein
MPEKNSELWEAYDEVIGRIRAIDNGLAMDMDVAAMNLKTAEVDQARLEALSGAKISGQLLFEGPSGIDGPEVTVRFVPAVEVPA